MTKRRWGHDRETSEVVQMTSTPTPVIVRVIIDGKFTVSSRNFQVL